MSYLSTPGFFDVLDNWSGAGLPIMAGPVSLLQAQQNALIIQSAIWAAQVASASTCGDTVVAGEIVIPGHSVVPNPVGGGGTDLGAEYFLAIPPVNAAKGACIVIDCNWPVKIRGTGNCKLIMQYSNPATGAGGGDLFQIGNNVGDNTGGVTFEDLTFHYPNYPGETAAPPPWAAVHVTSVGANNVRLNRCIFEDCPTAFFVEQGLQFCMLECLIEYTKGGNVGTGVILGNTSSMSAAKEVFITDCLFEAGESPNGSMELTRFRGEVVFGHQAA